jgi:signal transduction histidine kinase
MRILTKILVIITVFCFSAIFVISLISDTMLLSNYRELESDLVSSHIIHFRKGIEVEIDNLASIVNDWARWDDTYEFIAGKKPEYISSNLVLDAFINLRVNFMVFLNSSQDVFYARSVDLQTGELINLSDDWITEILSYGEIIFDHNTLESNIHGIITLAGSPLLFSSAPIITSEYAGPSHGILLMGRFLDRAEVEYLKYLTDLNASIFSPTDDTISEGIGLDSLFYQNESSFIFNTSSDHIIEGYAVVHDISGEPSFIMKISTSRSIYQQGKRTIVSLQLTIGLLGLFVGSIFIIVLYSTIISRLTSLTEQMRSIKIENSAKHNVKMKGNDEIGILAQSINETLHELDLNRSKLSELNETLEEQVKDRTAKVNSLLKHKDEFINQLGHDLKNPLGPLISLLPILKNHATTDKDKEIIDTLLRNVNYIRNLVVKTIALAQLNSPNLKLKAEEIKLEELIDEVLQDNNFLINKKKINVEKDIPTDLKITADRLWMHEVFINLLNNAINFSPTSGTIVINARADPSDVTVSIHDNGIGMTKNQLDHIFDEFYKADGSRHDFDSSGLGLSIVKRIVEKHGGNIWAESQGKGKGSHFFFTIPSSLPSEKHQ